MEEQIVRRVGPQEPCPPGRHNYFESKESTAKRLIIVCINCGGFIVVPVKAIEAAEQRMLDGLVSLVK
jgi:hypothetical protein